MSGQEVERFDISNVTQANPCVVTTASNHGFSTDQFVRLTDMNSSIPVLRGMDPINNKKFKIVVTGNTTFYLKDPITFKDIDSSNYPAYVEGGSCNLVQNEFIYEGD